MDASTVGDTAVTVAVHATRRQELAILDSIYEHSDELGFKPFYNKANDFEYDSRREFSERIIEANRGKIAAFAHDRGEGNTNLQQVEAVHSAIHVNDYLVSESDPLVIIDGNEQKAVPFVEALSGLRTELPTVAHCLKSEYYYPNALLADLTASYLAHAIERGEYNYSDPILQVPFAKQARDDDWGKAFSGMFQNNLDYTPAELPTHRGDTVRERVCCWYEGAVFPDQGAEPPFSDSLNPVVRALEDDGYEELAEILSQL